MSEADALQSEDPSGCLETAMRRGGTREGWRYQLVAAELIRRGADRCAETTAQRAGVTREEDDRLH